MNRKSFPLAVESQVLVKCRRRCALCYFLDNDLRWKKGQLAHVDRNHSNATLENAAYLCTTHHDEYDTRPSQTKRFTPAELRAAQSALYEVLESPDWWRFDTHSVPSQKGRKRRIRGVSLEVYERRFPIYRATVEFIRQVVKELNPELNLILKFAGDTEEALFLFDETVAAYLEIIFKKALRLHTINRQRERLATDVEMQNLSALINEEAELALWFSNQYEAIRNHFAPFLRLANS